MTTTTYRILYTRNGITQTDRSFIAHSPEEAQHIRELRVACHESGWDNELWVQGWLPFEEEEVDAM